MNVRFFFKFGAVVMAILLTMESSMAQQQINLRGRILSSQGGPIRGASVTFFNEAKSVQEDCMTNSQGNFSHSTKSFRTNNRIFIRVEAAGYESFQKDYMLKTGDFGTITLPMLLRINGTIQSDEGIPLKDAVIMFTDPMTEEELYPNEQSRPNGHFETKNAFKKGQRVKITVTKTGFGEKSKDVIIESPSKPVDVGLERRLIIAGYVRDSVTQKGIQGADVYFYDKEGRRIKAIKTNQDGYYSFDAPFTPGEVIRVRFEKDSTYVPSERQLSIIRHEIAPPRLDVDLSKWDRIRLEFYVHDKKKKPLEGVEISYFDREPQKAFTPKNGKALLKIYQMPGKTIEFQFSIPGYKTKYARHNLGEQIEYIDVLLAKDKSNCPCWLYTAAALAAGSGTFYILSAQNIKKHKNLKDLNRRDYYDTGAAQRKVGTVAGGLALGAFTGWIICRAKEKSANQSARERGRLSNLVPWSPPQDGTQGIQLGIAFRF